MVLSTRVDLKLRNFAWKGSHVFNSRTSAVQVQHCIRLQALWCLLCKLSAFCTQRRLLLNLQFQRRTRCVNLHCCPYKHKLRASRIFSWSEWNCHFLSQVFETVFLLDNEVTQYNLVGTTADSQAFIATNKKIRLRLRLSDAPSTFSYCLKPTWWITWEQHEISWQKCSIFE